MWPGAGQRKVPRPGQPVDGFGIRAFGGGEPRHLGKSAGDDRRTRVVAEAEAYGAAGGDRDDILHGAADRHAKRVVAGIDAQLAGPE